MTSTPQSPTTSTTNREVRAVSRRFRAAGLGTAGTTLVAAVAVLTGGAAPATSAPAELTAAASPAIPSSLPSAIEALQPFVGQSTCSPSAKPGVVAFRNLLLATYPRSGSLGIVRDCGVGGTSEHKEGRAFDWAVAANDPQDVAEVEAMFAWLFATDQYGNTNAMLRRTGLMYVIWNKKIWKAYAPEKGWQVYSGPNTHRDHVHMSFGWNGAKKTTSYWDRTVAPVDFGPRPPMLPKPTPSHQNIAKRAPYENTVVQQGSVGNIVKIVQAGVLAKPVDGYYGPDTAAFVARFQASQNLPQTGVFGRVEWQRLFPYPTQPFGVFDSIESTSAGVTVTGWGIDADALARPLTVRPVVDGTSLPELLADRDRPDVGSYYPTSGNRHGIELTIPSLTQGRHEVCLTLVNVGAGLDGSLNCRSIDVTFGELPPPGQTPPPVTPPPTAPPTPVITPPPAQVSAKEVGGTLVSAPAQIDVPQNGSALTGMLVRNTGSRDWPVNGVVRSASLSPGDPSGPKGWLNPNRPGSVSSNVTRPGATTVGPGEVAQLDFRINGNGRAPITYTEAFGVVWDGVAFTDVKVPVTFRITGAPSVNARVTTPARSVDVPGRGAVATSFAAQNTGARAWPVGGLVRSTSLTAGNPSKDASWLAPTRPGSVAANLSRPGATTIEPGEIGRFDVTLAGNGRPGGSYREQFGVVYDGVAFTDVKVDVTYRVIGAPIGAGATGPSTAAPVAGTLVGTGARVDVPSHGAATTRFQVRNTGSRDWPLDGMVRSVAIGATKSMRSPSWLSAERAGTLTRNVSRAGADRVQPGEVAEFEVTLAGNGQKPAGTQVVSFGVVYDGVAFTTVKATLSYRIMKWQPRTITGRR